ncbi:MAG: dTDP-4-dehydrorhamnose 3,5-epimerase [Chlamydiota bacterium]|nr:dTDP-4-dehydrorhamnose 3,5-epimerase [Chlamydiota bacterium]
MQCIQTPLPGVLIIEPRVFTDQRGFFLETFQDQKYRDLGIAKSFVQDNHSHSSYGVLRGMHYQLRYPQGKLVYAVSGDIFDVVIDIRKGSESFGQWFGCTLSCENRRQLYVPEGYAHGFCVLSRQADVIYKCTELYHPEDEFGLIWSDPQVGVQWPIENPTLSEKDNRYPALNQIPDEQIPCY